MKFLASPFFWPLYSWLFISVAAPTPTSSYVFVHIQPSEALSINISKNSPPLAALSDEVLPQISFEPKEDIKADKNSRVMLVTEKPLWPKLKKYSDYFEKEQAHQAALKLGAEKLLAKIKFQDVKVESKAEALTEFRISELTKLIQPVAETFHSYAVERSLPRGEEAPPIVDPEPTTNKPTTNTAPKFSIAARAPVLQPLPPAAPTVAAADIPPKNENIMRQASNGKVAEQKGTSEILGLDGGSENKFILKGQVELSGGLAAIQDLNNLRVFWKTAVSEEDAFVDYSTGKFLLQVSNISAGKLIANLYDPQKRILGRGEIDLNDYQDKASAINNLKLLVEPLESSKGGQVISAYSYDKYKIPVTNAEVFAPAQTREVVDHRGAYGLSNLSGNSTYILDAYAQDYWSTRVIVEGGIKQTIPLFPYKMLQNFFDIIKQSDNSSEYGVVWGKVTKRGAGIKGAQVQLSAPSAVGPIYFNEAFIPDVNLKETSANGLYAFVKVPAGLYVVGSSYKGKEIPSSIVSTDASKISYSEIQLKALHLTGKIVDPIYKQNVNAKISFVGTTIGGDAGEAGFNIKIPSTDSVVFMNINAGPDYFLSREALPRSQTKNVEAFAVRKSWLSEEMLRAKIKQHEALGMFFGYVKGDLFHVSLDHERASEQGIYYFNDAGRIDVSKVDSEKTGGAFLITNLKPGLHTLIITSGDGQTTTSRLFVSEAGVLNVLNTTLRP